MAAAVDSKSTVRDDVWVRLPSPVPFKRRTSIDTQYQCFFVSLSVLMPFFFNFACINIVVLSHIMKLKD